MPFFISGLYHCFSLIAPLTTLMIIYSKFWKENRSDSKTAPRNILWTSIFYARQVVIKQSLFLCISLTNCSPDHSHDYLQEALKRKSIQFKESPSADKSDNGQSKKKFAKTPIRVGGGGGGNRGSAGGAGVYAPPQGKYSSGLDSSMGKSNKVFH